MTATVSDTELKVRHRAMWASGDYPRMVETFLLPLGPRLVEACGITAGQRVLDVAAGTGNASLPAAQRGAQVTASDLTPELLAEGRRRAEADGLQLEWQEADAEHLPFDDASYDVVMSCIGVMFAPHHQESADELVRVCRPGGTVGLLCWTPEGMLGGLFRTMKPFMTPPPPGAQPPPLWGSEEHVRALFADLPVEVEVGYGHNPWRFASAEHFVSFLETQYGPTLKARERLTSEGRWDDTRRELVAIAESFNEATDGSLLMQAEYLVVTGDKTF